MEAESDDEMGNSIRVDSPEYHIHNPKPEAPKAGGLAKLALAAGLLATGAGAGIGIPLILDSLKPQPVSQPEPETKTETIIKPGKTFDWRVGTPIVE